MKKQFVSELEPGLSCDSVFVARDKQMRESRNKPGTQYLHVMLRDRDGEIMGRIWDNAVSLASRFEEGDLIAVEGEVVEYNKALQVNIATLKRVSPEQLDLADFVPCTPKEVDALIANIHATIDSLTSRPLRALLDAFYRNEAFLIRFRRAPAAKTLHHAYLGGLAEHFCAVLVLAEALCKVYPQLSRDLLVTGVLLHDIGKLHELRQGMTFDYTDNGRLLGHIFIGAQMVNDAMRELEDFPPELSLRVTHMILSHHGTREFGAVVLPATPEAIALHLIENADAQMQQVFRLIDLAKPHDAPWTEFNRLHQRYFATGRAPLVVE